MSSSSNSSPSHVHAAVGQALAAALSFWKRNNENNQTVEDDDASAEQQQQDDEDETLFQRQLRLLIPDYEDSDEYEEAKEEEEQNSNDSSHDEPLNFSTTEEQPFHFLETLGSDLVAAILSHLTLTELSSSSLVSKHMYTQCRCQELWRQKFIQRWNYRLRGGDYVQSYQNAYLNTHDLWVTHWNITYPHDGDSAGRCCIKRNDEKITRSASSHDDWTKFCPTCRYSAQDEAESSRCRRCLPKIVQEAIEREQQYQTDKLKSSNMPDPVDQAELAAAAHGILWQEHHNNTTTKAKAIHATTQYAIAKWCRNVHPLLLAENNTEKINKKTSSIRARRAFQKAATFHRKLNTQQYQDESLHFLTDALFFNVSNNSHLDLSSMSQQEFQHLQKDIYSEHNSVANTSPTCETTHHSWHIIRLTNPDYIRPITFRVFVQRPDCFTVFPSQGYLEPGETTHVVLGVRNLGSLLSEAFEGLNVQREQVDPMMADVYANEAHLPYAPFLIRYMFAPVTPCIPPSFTSRGGTKSQQESKHKHVVSYLWDNVATESNVRTIHLSAHVHANYRLEDFQYDTLQPFDIRVDSSDDWGPKTTKQVEPLVFLAPNLMEKDPEMFERVMNLRHELELSDAGEAARTEKKCLGCGRDWGARSEELGRAHVLQVLSCDARARQQRLQMRNLFEFVRQIYSCIHHPRRPIMELDLSKTNQVLYILHSVLTRLRAVPLVGRPQRKQLLQVECVVDDLCDLIQTRIREAMESLPASEREFMYNLWRNVGCYPYVKCSDSIFGSPIDLEIPDDLDLPFIPILKSEVDYLEGFRYLCHSPGIYCLGQQEDPNHEGDTHVPHLDRDTSPLNSAFRHDKRNRTTDLFMESTAMAFASALSIIHDPRSLVVHGIYDRVPSPGTITRRPSLPSRLFKRVSTRDKTALLDAAYVLAKKWKRQHLNKTSLMQRYGEGPRFSLALARQPCLLLGDVDHDSHQLLHIASDQDCSLDKFSSLRSYLHNIPPPGVGKYAFSALSDESTNGCQSDIVELHLQDGSESDRVSQSNDEEEEDGPSANPPPPAMANNQNNHLLLHPLLGVPGRGPRVINLLWSLSEHLGWSVDESHGAGSVMVERRILIASQWVSNSLMALPLLYTLIARASQWMTLKPMEYHFDGLPYDLKGEMRYLTAGESVGAAILVVLLWLKMGRYAERRIGRTYERAMREHLSSHPSRTASSFSVSAQRLWDRVCPLFLQRLCFAPGWNRRSDEDVLRHVASWRSKDMREHRSCFHASDGQGLMTYGGSVSDGGPPLDVKEESAARKLLTGLFVALGSFTASSPHFMLNLLTVFSCSLALGMSVSLQSMEIGRRTRNTSSARSFVQPLSFNTIIIAFALLGQLVGSSGGVLFLAEFVVTTMSLLLGGAGTISASAMESWAVFFCLSSTAFWGYVFARVGLADGIRHRRRGPSTIVLCTCLVVLTVLWIFFLGLWRWDSPPALMIVASGRAFPDKRGVNRATLGQRVQ